MHLVQAKAALRAALCASPVAAGMALVHPCHIYVHVKEARQPTGAACCAPGTGDWPAKPAMLRASMGAAWPPGEDVLAGHRCLLCTDEEKRGVLPLLLQAVRSGRIGTPPVTARLGTG